jgi:hypothetical protein
MVWPLALALGVQGDQVSGEQQIMNENVCLCNDCAELEVWASRQHDVKYNVCFAKELLTPNEKECKNYKKLEKTAASSSRLCQSCVRLETWHSKLYERKAKEDSIFETKSMEVCTAHNILSPNMINCNEYIMIGSQSKNTLCRSCTNLTVWQSQNKTIQAEICKIRHKILPIRYSCEYHKTRG